MGKTFAEKIIGKKAGKDVSAGEIVVIKPDVCLSHDNTAAISDTFRKLGVDKLDDSKRHVIILDHTVPAPTETHAKNHKIIREFVEQMHIENFYDLNNGICHQVLPEKGHALPGTLIVGSDSHTTTHGAFNAFACGIGRSEAAVIMATGEIWLRVPQTLRLILHGKLPDRISAKDVVLKIIGEIKADGADYMSVQFEGELVENMSIGGRMVLCNMAAEMGAKNSFIPPDQKAIDYLKGRAKRPFEVVLPDSDADYAQSYTYDAATIEPMIACPHTVDNVLPLSQVAGTRVQQAFLGTCTNGRLEDLAAAATVLKGRKVAHGTRLLIIPASSQVYMDALKAGHIETFLEAGAIIESPGCGPCMGNHMGVPAIGEVSISTANRNFQGRMGTKESEIYLASPVVVAATAVAGEIVHPKDL